MPGPVVERVRDDLTEPVRRRRQRVRSPAGQQVEPAGRGQLDHRVVAADGVRRADRFPGRALDVDAHLAEPGRERGRHGSVAAVRHRQQGDGDVRAYDAQPARDRLRDREGREAALELVRGDDDVHAVSPAG